MRAGNCPHFGYPQLHKPFQVAYMGPNSSRFSECKKDTQDQEVAGHSKGLYVAGSFSNSLEKLKVPRIESPRNRVRCGFCSKSLSRSNDITSNVSQLTTEGTERLEVHEGYHMMLSKHKHMTMRWVSRTRLSELETVETQCIAKLLHSIFPSESTDWGQPYLYLTLYYVVGGK